MDDDVEGIFEGKRCCEGGRVKSVSLPPGAPLLISEVGRGVKALLEKEIPANRMRNIMERIVNCSTLTPQEWRVHARKEFFSEPDHFLAKTFKMVGIDQPRPELALINAAKASVSTSVGALVSALLRYPSQPETSTCHTEKI